MGNISKLIAKVIKNDSKLAKNAVEAIPEAVRDIKPPKGGLERVSLHDLFCHSAPEVELIMPEGALSYRALSSKPLKLTKNTILGVNIDNLTHPYGALGVVQDINEAAYTSSLWQCAALSLVDKKSGRQCLTHITKNCPPEELAKYLCEDFGSKAGPGWKERAKLTIVPGCFDETRTTVNNILDSLNKIDPNLPSKVEFRHLSSSEILFLSKGKLFEIPLDSLKITGTNTSGIVRPIDISNY